MIQNLRTMTKFSGRAATAAAFYSLFATAAAFSSPEILNLNIIAAIEFCLGLKHARTACRNL